MEYTDNDIHYKFISSFPEGFDVKEIDEDLNVCDRCGIIVRWFDEMYWAGEECMETNDVLGDYDAVCDDCYGELYNKKEGE
tara:strand:- start:42 stop:284 length:243 start_codon:yes stop_codon:yes gene_type:complete